MIRNFINIKGIASEKDIPEFIHGESYEYSECDYVDIPNGYPDISSIYEASISLEISNYRTITLKHNKVITLDGRKKFKFMYTSTENNKISMLDLTLPYNTFFEINSDTNIKNAEVYILDAFIEKVSPKKIYYFLVFMVCVEYGFTESSNLVKTNSIVFDKGNTNKLKSIDNIIYIE